MMSATPSPAQYSLERRERLAASYPASSLFRNQSEILGDSGWGLNGTPNTRRECVWSRNGIVLAHTACFEDRNSHLSPRAGGPISRLPGSTFGKSRRAWSPLFEGRA